MLTLERNEEAFRIVKYTNQDIFFYKVEYLNNCLNFKTRSEAYRAIPKVEKVVVSKQSAQNNQTTINESDDSEEIALRNWEQFVTAIGLFGFVLMYLFMCL